MNLIATVLAFSFPAGASAGPLKEAAAKAARELALVAQGGDTGSRGRFWTGIALIGGGVTLATLGGVELGEDEGPGDVDEPGDDPEDEDGPGEESDGAGGKWMLGGGVAAAAVGSWLLVTGKKGTGPLVSIRRGGVSVRHTVRF